MFLFFELNQKLNMHKSKRFMFSKHRTMFAWCGSDFMLVYFVVGSVFFHSLYSKANICICRLVLSLPSDNEFMRSLPRLFIRFIFRSQYFAGTVGRSKKKKQNKVNEMRQSKRKIIKLLQTHSCNESEKKAPLKLDICPLWSMKPSHIGTRPPKSNRNKKANEKRVLKRKIF